MGWYHWRPVWNRIGSRSCSFHFYNLKRLSLVGTASRWSWSLDPEMFYIRCIVCILHSQSIIWIWIRTILFYWIEHIELLGLATTADAGSLNLTISALIIRCSLSTCMRVSVIPSICAAICWNIKFILTKKKGLTWRVEIGLTDMRHYSWLGLVKTREKFCKSN